MREIVTKYNIVCNCRVVICCLFFITSLSMRSQVGIKEVSPTATLEINGDSTLPLMSIVPQSPVMGVDTGQMAVIDDVLYMYDNVRAKWLSLEVTLIGYGLGGNVTNQDIEFIGDVEKSGPLMPFDGTLVYLSANSSSGDQDKIIFIDVYDAPDTTTPYLTLPMQLVNGTLAIDTLNIDIQTGDHFQVRADSGPVVRNLVFKFWIKRRVDNP